MKKIMFNDRYGLTKAVLDGRKTMTRRIVPSFILNTADQYRLEYYNNTLENISLKDAILNMVTGERMFKNHVFRVGEVLAIAQSYKNLNELGYLAPEWLDGVCEDSAGYTNKMFVRADLMPHRIQITDIKLELLQAISFEDCLREGIEKYDNPKAFHRAQFDFPNSELTYMDPVFAFCELIDKVSGKGTWESNPFVFAYTFKLLD